MIALTRDPISTAAVLQQVYADSAGAVVTFDGRVRDHSRGKEVTHLYYEAYEPMALDELARIRDEALGRWPLTKVIILHRLGRLKVGESSVLIAVSAAHRKPAFEACRFLIDTLKTTVPIWKKEFFPNGESWVESYGAG